MEISQVPDIDQAQVLQQLILETNLEGACDMGEYVHSEDSLPICHEYDDEKWDDQFMSNLASESATEEPNEPDEDDEDHDIEVTAEIEAPLRISSFPEVVKTLEDVKLYLESKQCLEVAQDVGFVIDSVAACRRRFQRQTTVDEFIV